MDSLERAILADPKWASQAMVFLLDNPEFQPYKNRLPCSKHQRCIGKYAPININDCLINIVCKKYYDEDLYKNLKDGFLASSDIPPVIKKLKTLPRFKSYDDFYNYVNEEMDMDYFEPQLNRLQLFALFDEIDINWNPDINGFSLYGIFDKSISYPPDPHLIDVWTRERKFIYGMEKVYNKEFKNGYEALMQAQKWKRYHYVGYMLCLSI